ncbi:MAG: hypothetical protein KF819_21695 [Labilithrix sp.]|nr:hypothetical protein [Labilithrix sp.]
MRTGLSWLVALVAIVLVVRATAPIAFAAPPPYVVIVNAKNPGGRLSRKFVTDAMLKKTTRWPDGRVVKPVDLPPDSPVRRTFTQEVLKRSVEAVRAYWQQIVFAGRDVPPPELGTDADVVKFVSTHEGALGYVSATQALDGAKAVVVE